MTTATIAVLAAATFLCSLTAGFLFAFAVVVMPGLRGLSDPSYLRAFQLIDGVIQNNQPLFGLMWVGSIVAMLAAVAIGLPTLSGTPRALVVAAALLYVGGVQAPTVAVNIPLNNEVQALDLATRDAGAAAEARARFEGRWNRWNVFRTVIAVLTVVLLLSAFGATARLSAQVSEASRGVGTHPAMYDGTSPDLPGSVSNALASIQGSNACRAQVSAPHRRRAPSPPALRIHACPTTPRTPPPNPTSLPS